MILIGSSAVAGTLVVRKLFRLMMVVVVGSGRE